MASIRERPTAGGKPRYVVQYRHDGRQRTETLTRKRDAEKLRDLINALGPDEALARLRGPASVGTMPTVAEWLTKHIDDLTGVTDRTRADYRAWAKRHISGTVLGPLDIDEVTPADISRWQNNLEGKLAAKSIANLRALLSAAFGYAVDEKLRSDNPMRRLRRSRAGKHSRVRMTCLTPQEFLHLRSLMPEPWRPFITLLVGTGLRFGEAIVLTVADVDLLAPTPVLRVTKALQRVPGGFEVAPPKSDKSERTVSLSPDLVDVLAPHVTRPGTELLFTGPAGVRISHSNFHGRIWTPTVQQFEAATGKHVRIHDLRHSHASHLIAAGVHLEAIRDRLGHESITTTSSVYSHLLPDQHARTAAALAGLLVDEVVG